MFVGVVRLFEFRTEIQKQDFGSKAGELAGNHFLTITEGKEKLMDIGREILYNGAETVEISIL